MGPLGGDCGCEGVWEVSIRQMPVKWSDLFMESYFS